MPFPVIHPRIHETNPFLLPSFSSKFLPNIFSSKPKFPRDEESLEPLSFSLFEEKERKRKFLSFRIRKEEKSREGGKKNPRLRKSGRNGRKMADDCAGFRLRDSISCVGCGFSVSTFFPFPFFFFFLPSFFFSRQRYFLISVLVRGIKAITHAMSRLPTHAVGSSDWSRVTSLLPLFRRCMKESR